MRELTLGGRFPPFKKMISAMDFQQDLLMLRDLGLYKAKEAEAGIGVVILLDAFLPKGTALLIDKDEKIVAVIQDRKVVEIK